jgi:hypothetical protein
MTSPLGSHNTLPSPTSFHIRRSKANIDQGEWFRDNGKHAVIIFDV